jgi:hypothetical protein
MLKECIFARLNDMKLTPFLSWRNPSSRIHHGFWSKHQATPVVIKLKAASKAVICPALSILSAFVLHACSSPGIFFLNGYTNHMLIPPFISNLPWTPWDTSPQTRW